MVLLNGQTDSSLMVLTKLLAGAVCFLDHWVPICLHKAVDALEGWGVGGGYGSGPRDLQVWRGAWSSLGFAVYQLLLQGFNLRAWKPLFSPIILFISLGLGVSALDRAFSVQFLHQHYHPHTNPEQVIVFRSLNCWSPSFSSCGNQLGGILQLFDRPRRLRMFVADKNEVYQSDADVNLKQSDQS